MMNRRVGNSIERRPGDGMRQCTATESLWFGGSGTAHNNLEIFCSSEGAAVPIWLQPGFALKKKKKMDTWCCQTL